MTDEVNDPNTFLLISVTINSFNTELRIGDTMSLRNICIVEGNDIEWTPSVHDIADTKIAKIYKLKQNAHNLFKDTKNIFPREWLTDFSQNNTWTTSINSNDFREFTQVVTNLNNGEDKQVNGYQLFRTRLSDYPYNIFKIGKRYTFSFEYKSTVSIRIGLSLRPLDNPATNLGYVIPIQQFPSSTEWKRIYISNIMSFSPNTDATQCLVMITINRWDTELKIGDTMSLRAICLVEGTDTEWTPSAREVENLVVYNI